MAWMRGAVISLLALVWMVPAWAAGGWVYDVSGDVSVAVGKQAAHRATMNDAIASDTVISTGDKAYAVLKFEDGQVVTMQANSTFHVREYSYQPDNIEKSNMIFAMLKGGMRFVTGLVGQRNKAAFKLSTPNATIGIRGTDFMVAMAVNNPSMYAQVVSGSIGMTNAAGTLALGAEQAAVVASATTLGTVIPVSALPAGTFTQLFAIPVPPATPAPPPGAGGAATGGASTTTTAATATAGAGVSATTIAVGVGIAAGVAAVTSTSTTTHH